MSIRVREFPPLRHTIEIETPSGSRYRWAEDALNARDVPSDVSESSTMPGGFENFQATLPRKPGETYTDLREFSTITSRSAGGEIVGEYRLERTPRVSGDQMAINPSAVGWQAHLTDDQTAQLIVIDRDLGHWQGPSRQRQADLDAAGFNVSGGTVLPDATTGAPSIQTGFDEGGGWGATDLPVTESWYDAGAGNLIGRLRATWTRGVNVSAGADANWVWIAVLATDDIETPAMFDQTGDLQASGPSTIDLAASTGTRRFAELKLYYGIAGGADQSNLHYAIDWSNTRVIGLHTIPLYGTSPDDEGVLMSDVVAYVVSRWAPLLNFTEGADGTIRPSTFIVPHLAWPDPTNPGDMIRQCSRFGLEDWAVWERRTMHWGPRGQGGRNWRARVAQAGLEETGPQIDRVWESVVVQYRDVDGSTRTVGPPGTLADAVSSDLKDPDPDNPANQLGAPRRALLQAGTLSGPTAAIEIGRRFLEAQKHLDTSGRARFVGHVLDDHGVLHPYSHVRGGDNVTFTDAADTSPRRIVRAQHDHKARAATVDLDAPPDGMTALLERLGVVLAPLGV